MIGIDHTKHSKLRAKQRGIKSRVIEVLFCYGVTRRTRDGAESLSFTKEVLA